MIELLTVNQLTGPKSETGHVWHGPVNRNCSHSPRPLPDVSVHCRLDSLVQPAAAAAAAAVRLRH